jgi:hypothetical protein
LNLFAVVVSQFTMPSRKSWSKSLLLAGLLPLRGAVAQQYLLGVGIGDVTGYVLVATLDAFYLLMSPVVRW